MWQNHTLRVEITFVRVKITMRVEITLCVHQLYEITLVRVVITFVCVKFTMRVENTL
jgi:hypothetical protein